MGRYLRDEPVEACPPSAGYRLKKFARRHKGPVAAVALVLLTIVAGVVGSTFGLIQARRSHRVEWYIVILIVFEILLTLYQLIFLGGH